MPALKREGIMMCCPFSVKRFELWGSQAFVQPKLNGERCRVIWDSEGNLSMRSSYDKEIVSVPHLYQSLSELNFKDIELDGELYLHGMDLRAIQGIVSRRVNLHTDFEKMELHLFDYVSSLQQNDRTVYLNTQIAPIMKHVPKVHIVDTYQVGSLKSFEDLLQEFVEHGYEGVIARKIDGVYQRNLHSTQIMKFKPREEDIYTIIGVEEEISIHGEPKNALGAFVCRVGEEQEFRVGTGSILTRSGREWYWKNPPIGKNLRVKYQELTPNGIPYTPVACEVI